MRKNFHLLAEFGFSLNTHSPTTPPPPPPHFFFFNYGHAPVLFYSALKISISLEAGGWKLKKVGYVVKALLTVFARLDAAPPSATSEKISSRSRLVAALEYE